MNLSWFLESLRQEYYIYGLQFFTELATLIIALLYVRNTNIGRVFILLISVDFLIGLFDMYIETLRSQKDMINLFLSKTQVLISSLQLFVYYYFYRRIIRSVWIKYYINITYLLFLIAVLIFFISGYSLSIESQYNTSFSIEAVELILLMPLSFIYIRDMLNKESSYGLFERPTFWINTGILFFCVLSIPYDIMHAYLTFNNIQYRVILFTCLYTMPFTINLAFLIKAFLCKKPLTI